MKFIRSLYDALERVYGVLRKLGLFRASNKLENQDKYHDQLRGLIGRWRLGHKVAKVIRLRAPYGTAAAVYALT